MKKVSIVVPVYNVEKYLVKCVDSLINQTYSNLEIILVNDGSTDSSPKLCDGYVEKHEMVRAIHKQNGGLSDARNAGVDAATGSYIMFIDSDDFLEVDAVETLVKTVIEQDCQIVNMKSNIVNSDYTVRYNQSNGTRSVEKISSSNYIIGMCKKALSESVCDKLFDINLFKNRRFEKGILNEDFLFLSKLLFEDLDIAIIDYTGYNYYQRFGSITNTSFSKSVTDAVRNSFELAVEAQDRKPELEIHFASLALFQLRVAFITIPYELVKREDKVYIDMKNQLKNLKKYIKTANIAKTDKMILRMVLLCPKFTLFLLSRIWSVKKAKG